VCTVYPVSVGFASPARRPAVGLASGSLFGFALLGLSDAMLGVAWPSLRSGFDQPLGALAELLLASLAGYLCVAATAGRTLQRVGTPSLLLAAAATAATGAALIAASPWWGVVVIAALLLGLAGGALDTALNTVVSLARRPRLMNLIHAGYGVGAALGPLLVTASLAAAASWRGAYAVLALLDVVLAGVWLAARGVVPRISHHPEPAAAEGAVPGAVRPRRRTTVLLLSLGLFFSYTGLEVEVGAWSASFLRGPAAFSATAAGILVFLYWAGLTAGRFGTAALGGRLPAAPAATLGALVGLTGGIILWGAPGRALTAISLPMLGIGLGPIFPALVTLTPSRLGPALTVHAVGWQLGAAGVGGTGISAVIGLALQASGLGGFGAATAVLAARVAGLTLTVDRLSA
jgi:fucose permease